MNTKSEFPELAVQPGRSYASDLLSYYFPVVIKGVRVASRPGEWTTMAKGSPEGPDWDCRGLSRRYKTTFSR
jgi:hypothetical protein